MYTNNARRYICIGIYKQYIFSSWEACGDDDPNFSRAV